MIDPPETAPIQLLLVESDGLDQSRLEDELSEAAVVTRLSASGARDRLASGRVDCLVVGEDESFLRTVVTEYPTVPVVRFAELESEVGSGVESVEHVSPSRPGSTAILAARIEAAVANRRVRALEATTDRTADAVTDGLALVSPAGRITDLFGPFAELVGRDPGDLLGRPIASVYAGEGGMPEGAEIETETKTEAGTGTEIETEARRKTETETIPNSDSDGEISDSVRGIESVLAGDCEQWTGTLVLRTADADSLERAHTVFRTAGDRIAVVVHPVSDPSDLETVVTDHLIFESMLERLPVSLYVKDETATHVRASRNQVTPPIETPDGELLTDPDQLLGKTDSELYAPNLADDTVQDDRRVIETGEPVIDKLERYEVGPGNDRWTLTSKVPWTDADGTTCGLVGSTIDVTAEIEHERELERQHERLEEFASVVAHDLRNPLNVARGYVDLARQLDDTDLLEDVDDSFERMQRLIDDVLLLARQGNAALTMTAVSLQTVLEEAWSYVSTAEATLRVVGDVRFEADRGRLMQLVENLLRNAIDHGHTATVVTVEPLTADGTTVGFALEDDGPGIDLDDRETVFESGYTTSEEGTGFGLAIVEQIVDAHDWEIDVGEGADGGARFEIRGVDGGDR